MDDIMDITVILPPTNKAGINLIKMLKQDGKQKEFKKVVSIMTSYTNVNQQLLEKQLITQYVYDVIYKDYKNKITEKIEAKYCSHVLCILHKKYVDFLIEMRKIIELCNENNEIFEENNEYEEND